jgi:ubiquinone/menaquinone biosynthesis C-methylase UbiE
MSVDPRAERGFGSGADDYDRYRPGWPDEAIERALAALGIGPESTVVDLAAGTGKLTRALVGRTGRTVAVEPSADMLRRLREVVPDADAVDGTADAMPFADASVDGVFVAEAFHWFATSPAAAEIARVLRPGGGVALLWNLHDYGPEPWLEPAGRVLAPVLAPVFEAANRNRPERWQDAFAGAPFGPFERFDVRHEQRTDVEGLVAHVLTWSHTRGLDETVREELARELGEVLMREPDSRPRGHPVPDRGPLGPPQVSPAPRAPGAPGIDPVHASDGRCPGMRSHSDSEAGERPEPAPGPDCRSPRTERAGGRSSRPTS